MELDRKEGAGFAYRRRHVEVELAGEPREAMTYEVIDKETGRAAGHARIRRPRARAAPASAGCRRSGSRPRARVLRGSVPAR